MVLHSVMVWVSWNVAHRKEARMERVYTLSAPSLYALLRIVGGLLYACHGAQKLFGVLGGVGGHPGATVPLVSLMGLAGIIELCGGLLIAGGVLTRPAAFIASHDDRGIAAFLAYR